MRPEQLPYGVKDFKRIRLEGRYYVDKTEYIRRLEQKGDYAFCVRPRRFGKSLFCEMLKCYYDVNEKDNFGKLFGDLAIGKNPTDQANRYCVLALDFSRVSKFTQTSWKQKFEAYIDSALNDFVKCYKELLSKDTPFAELLAINEVGSKYESVSRCLKRLGLKFYVIVDEYDNFTNQIASTEGLDAYKAVTHGNGFYREWFMSFKADCDRVFLTGVSPVTMDDLTSGFNISFNLTGEANFNGMIGFTEDETRGLFEDFQGCGKYEDSAEAHLDTVKRWYDGYCFSTGKAGKEFMYNCNMTLYYLNSLVDSGSPPEDLVDANISSDWNKLKMLLAAQREAENAGGVTPITEELAAKGEVTFPLVRSFPFERIGDKENFKSLFHYYGIVTINRVFEGDLYFKVPNECVRRQIFDYLRKEYSRLPNAVDLTEFVKIFNDFTWRGKWKEFFEYLAGKYANMGTGRDGIDGEARINGFIRSYLTIKNGYAVLPEMAHPQGISDYVLFPDWSLPKEYIPGHSYVIELKYSKGDADEAELERKHAEAMEQLKRYAADPNLEKLAGGTPVHFLTVEFKGKELARLEEVKSPPEAEMKSRLRRGEEFASRR